MRDATPNRGPAKFTVTYTPNWRGGAMGLVAGSADVMAIGTRDALKRGHQGAGGVLTDFRTIQHPDAHGLAVALTDDGDICGQFEAKRAR